MSVDTIAIHCAKMADSLQEYLDKGHVCDFGNPNLIHRLFAVRPLTWIEIPLDLLKLFITAGFHVNQYSLCRNETCLYVAIKNKHYNAIRLLAEHGAECERDWHVCSPDRRSPFTLLAEHLKEGDVPLDLFSLFATKSDLYNNGALLTVVSYGRSEAALYLIKLGAPKAYPHNEDKSWQKLPVCYFVEKYSETFNSELFTNLLPTRANAWSRGMDILIPICKILKQKPRPNKAGTVQMLQQLLQRLVIITNNKEHYLGTWLECHCKAGPVGNLIILYII